jgi:phosphopantetheinyl transferase
MLSSVIVTVATCLFCHVDRRNPLKSLTIPGHQQRIAISIVPSLRGKALAPAARARFLIDAIRRGASAVDIDLRSHDWSEHAITRTSYGKLVFVDSRAHFNLSHSGAATAVAVGAVPVGVDIEDPQGIPIHEFAGVERTTLSSGERGLSAMLDESDRRQLIMRRWTWKEAAVKAAGVGFSQFDASDLTADFAASIVTDARWGKTWAVADMLGDGGSLVGAVAIDGDTPPALVLLPRRDPVTGAEGFPINS